MKNLSKHIFINILTVSFVAVISLCFTQQVSAQQQIKPPFLPKFKDSAEVKELAQYAERLAEFYLLGDEIAKINTSPGTAEPSPELISKFKIAGIRVTQDERIFNANALKLVRNIERISSDKGLDHALAELKKEVEKLLQSRNVRPFFKEPLETVAGSVLQTDARRIEKDTKKIIEEPLKLGFYKPKFPCSVLATAIFAAELRNANKTAANVDLFFKSVCNANSSTDQ